MLSDIYTATTSLNPQPTMDFINKIANQATAHGDKPEGNAPQQQQQQQQQQSEHQSSSGGLMDKLQGLAGGGTKGEKDEDTLDKGTHLAP